MLPSNIEAKTYTEPVRVLLRDKVDQPIQYIKADTPLYSTDIRCNCYAYLKEYHFPDLPNTAHIRANLTDEIGGVAVFYYPQSDLYHYAKVVEHDGERILLDEANMTPCDVGTRVITKDDIRLLGFYK